MGITGKYLADIIDCFKVGLATIQKVNRENKILTRCSSCPTSHRAGKAPGLFWQICQFPLNPGDFNNTRSL
jgi:hypothetical protein